MNKWQEKYCETYYECKTPNTKLGKEEFEYLGVVGNTVTVHFPDFKGINGFKPAHTETYTITLDECDMPNGKIDVCTLASNLRFWIFRGYEVTTDVDAE